MIGKSLAASCLVLVTLSAVEARDLTIASWGGAYNDALRETLFVPFEKANGSHVAEDTYFSGLAELKAMVEASNAKWDVATVEGPELQLGCDEGLYEHLDWSRLGSRDTLIPGAASDCGAGSVVWGTVLSYNSDAVGANAPKTWADFWDTKTWPGKRGMRSGPKGNLEFALLADGVDVEDLYTVLRTPEGLDQAFAKLDELRGEVQFWDAGAQPAEWLTAGNVVMSTGYNARIAKAIDENRPIGFTWTNSQYAIDSWVIIAGSPNKELAIEFLAFANTAEPQLRFAELMTYGPTNAEAEKDLPAELAAKLPAGANIETSFFTDEAFWTDNMDQVTERWNGWVTR